MAELPSLAATPRRAPSRPTSSGFSTGKDRVAWGVVYKQLAPPSDCHPCSARCWGGRKHPRLARVGWGASVAWLVGGRSPPPGRQPSRERPVRPPTHREIPLHCRSAGHHYRVPLRGRRLRKRAAPPGYSFNFGQVEQMAGDNGRGDATGSLVWSAQHDRTEQLVMCRHTIGTRDTIVPP